MGKEKPKVQSILESVFISAIDKLSKADAGRLVGELYIQLDMSTGEIQVYDDQEILLEKNIIFDWADRSEKGLRSYKQPVHFIRVALAGLKSKKVFDNPVFMRPLTILLVDDNFNEIEMIYMLEDVDAVSEGRLMKNLEHELQIFSKKLFADME
ncbi:MAG: hypothetical protein LBV74_02655 [Tannerella sp.]|jgi:hypothetical protein|nr:hypothetical protein [Tannerella sp.]